MNAALNRPALNATILVSVIFHLAVLYYIASAWQILPTITTPQPPERRIEVIPQQPPPPKVPDDVEPPKVRPHLPDRVIPTTQVDPIPVPVQPPASTSDGPLVVNSTVPDQPTSFVKPAYPSIALNGEREGRVRLSITILADGSVTDVQVVSVNPPGYRFEQSAVEAVKKWRYPATGRVRTNVYVDIDYELRG